MSRGRWWPAEAPYPYRPSGDYTTHEINALLAWTLDRLDDDQRLALIRNELITEQEDRAEYARRFAELAAAGLPGIPARTAGGSHD